MLENIWAKSQPQESLAEHTDAIIKIWKELLPTLPHWALEDEFAKRTLLTVMFHDFGKVAQNFQDVIQGKRKNYDQFIRHEFLSGMLLWMTEPQFYVNNTASLFAIFSHHKPLQDALFQQDAEKKLIVENADFERLRQYASTKASHAGVTLIFSQGIEQQLKRDDILGLFYKNFKQKLHSLSENAEPKDRLQYIRYKAILQICDWTASGHQQLDQGISYTDRQIAEKVVVSLIEKGKMQAGESFSFREFQENSLQQGNIIAVAPTGSGKTEAALIWASQKQARDRIIYLLPTRVTSNAIYERLVNLFKKENCAVIHSSAFLYRKEQEDAIGNTNYHKFKDYLREKTFFRNINVATVDQLLTQGFNLGYWEIKTFHCMNARVIIDEVHLYQPYTLGLIIASVRYLMAEWNTQFYIMTATMPQKLLELLRETLKIEDSSIIRDSEYLKQARNTFEVRDKFVDDLEAEVWDAIDQEKKILLVVNTVDEAIRQYEHFKEAGCKVICYHSRFIQKHRSEKERDIFAAEGSGEAVLLIATQVVEVSLDIDFDILFTENAPIDALVQRAGRVNRKRKKENTKVIIFRHSEKAAEYIYNLPGVIDKTWQLLEQHNGQRLTEEKLTELVDEVYRDIDIKTNEAYQKGLLAYERMWKEHLAYIKDNTNQQEAYTREGMDTENVIPDDFIEDLFNSEDILEKSKHEVSVRRFRVIGAKHDKQGFKYLNCKYDYKTGLKFLKDHEGTSPGTGFF
jgi:CRISPR-associated endonuclease/helicase Cas3